MLYFEFRSHDWFVSRKNDHEIEIPNNAFLNFDLMIKNSTSRSKLPNINEQIRPHEQIEFRPHDRKFDLMKKLNFDHMKFDLLIISR